MTIKHLVLSGGGASGFTLYGILKHLTSKKYFDFKNIETINSVSAGCIISVLLLLSNDWEELDNYMIKRPWDKLFGIEPIKLLNIWKKKGLHDTTLFYEIYKPFLKLKDLSPDTTLLQLYEITGIEINMYATSIKDELLEKVILSHKTYPNLEVYKAVAMSSAFPILFEPIFYDNKCIIDGGILNNFPINECLEINKNKDEILGVNLISGDTNFEKLNEETTLPLYFYQILSNMHSLICENHCKPILNNKIEHKLKNNGISRWIECGNNEKVRKEYIDLGVELGENYLKSKEFQSKDL